EPLRVEAHRATDTDDRNFAASYGVIHPVATDLQESGGILGCPQLVRILHGGFGCRRCGRLGFGVLIQQASESIQRVGESSSSGGSVASGGGSEQVHLARVADPCSTERARLMLRPGPMAQPTFSADIRMAKAAFPFDRV